MMYLIDEELDRRRNPAGRNVGVWPASRILVAERMIAKEDDVVNKALDGGVGVKMKGFDQFSKQWEHEFKQPMGCFCERIDLMLKGRLKNEREDAPLCCLQHLVVDLVDFLDRSRAYIPKNRQALKCERSHIYCDCSSEYCNRISRGLDPLVQSRQESRLHDAGLWAVGHGPDIRGDYNSALDKQISLEEVEKMTYTINLA